MFEVGAQLLPAGGSHVTTEDLTQHATLAQHLEIATAAKGHGPHRHSKLEEADPHLRRKP